MSIDNIISDLNCSCLEALDVRSKALSFAETLINVSQTFATEHLVTTNEVSEIITDINKRKSFGHLNRGLRDRVAATRAKARLIGAVNAMWMAVFAAQTAHEELVYVIQLYDVGPIDETITTVFQVLHDTGALSNSQAVAEGREVFDRLVRAASGSLWPLGIERPVGEEIQALHEHDRHFATRHSYLRLHELV